MKRLGASFLALLVAAILCAGCGTGPVSSDAAEVNPEGWNSTDTVRLEFTVNNPDHRHDLQLGLRHNEDYPFSNLYLFVRLVYPNGRTLTDTLACPLAAPGGQWYGRGGKWIEHNIGYKQGVGFPLQGRYALEVVHAMRRDPLPGLSDIRFALYDQNAE